MNFTLVESIFLPLELFCTFKHSSGTYYYFLLHLQYKIKEHREMSLSKMRESIQNSVNCIRQEPEEGLLIELVVLKTLMYQPNASALPAVTSFCYLSLHHKSL